MKMRHNTNGRYLTDSSLDFRTHTRTHPRAAVNYRLWQFVPRGNPFSTVRIMESRLQIVGARIRSILDKWAVRDGTCKLVALRDHALAVLWSQNIPWRQVYHHSQVGVHPKNRGTRGLEAPEVIGKVTKFYQDGFSFSACAGAIAVERFGDAHELHNIRLAKQSPNQIAPVFPASLKVFTLICGHTFASLRAVAAGLPSPDPLVTGADGRLSYTKVIEGDDRYKQALDEGLPVVVIPYQVEQRWPSLIDLLIEADNVPGQRAKVDGPITVMMKMHASAQGQLPLDELGQPDMSCADQISWDLVQNAAINSNPALADSIPDLCAFIKNWSGGLAEPMILNDIDLYSKTLTTMRPLPAKVIGRLATLDLGPGVGGLWRGSCVKALLASPDKPLHAESKFIVTGDVTAMGAKNKAYVVQGDAMMTAARAILSKLDLTDPDVSSQVSAILGLFDVRLVAHAMQKPITSLGSSGFKSMGSIGAAFKADLLSLSLPEPERMMLEHAFPKSWCAPTAPLKAIPHSSASSETALKINADGSVDPAGMSRYLAAKGCKIGSLCVSKDGADSNSNFIVREITGSHILIAPQAKRFCQNKGLITVPMHELFDQYTFPKQAVKDVC